LGDDALSDSEFAGIQEALDQLATASCADLVGASQYPVQLDDGDQAQPQLRKPGSFSISASITVDAIAD